MTHEIQRARRAVIYLRIASNHPGDKGAIRQQREACQRIAAKHGLAIVREYADIGKPARFNQQTKLRQLLDDLSRHRDATYAVVWGYAVLARDMAQLDEVIGLIRARGADVLTMAGVETAERFAEQQLVQSALNEGFATTPDGNKSV